MAAPRTMARISAPTSASTARRLFSLRWEGAGGGGGGGEEIEKSGAFLLVRAGKGPWQGTSKAFPMAIKKKQKKQRGAALIRRPRPSARLPPTSPRGRDRRSQFVGWRVATRPWLLPQLRSGLSAARPAAQNWEPPQPIKLLCGRAPARRAQSRRPRPRCGLEMHGQACCRRWQAFASRLGSPTRTDNAAPRQFSSRHFIALTLSPTAAAQAAPHHRHRSRCRPAPRQAASAGGRGTRSSYLVSPCCDDRSPRLKKTKCL